MADRDQIEFDSKAYTPLRQVNCCLDWSSKPLQPAESSHKFQLIGASRI
jgi:hypothetical protein